MRDSGIRNTCKTFRLLLETKLFFVKSIYLCEKINCNLYKKKRLSELFSDSLFKKIKGMLI
jgi:hypothetical protein